MYTPTEEHFEDLTPKTSLPSPSSPWMQLNLVIIPLWTKKMPWDTLMKSNPASIGQIKFSLVPLYLVELPPQTPNNKHDTP